MMDHVARYRASVNVQYQEIDGEVVLLNMTTGRYLGLNRVGSEIWTQLMDQGDPSRVARWVAERYNVEADLVTRDTAALVEDLLRAGLLEQV